MKRLQSFGIVIVTLSFLIFGFQNCAKSGFLADSGATDMASSLLGAEAIHGASHVTLNSGEMKTGQDISATVYSDTLAPSASFEWSHKLNGVANACQIKSDIISKDYVINCSKPGELTISVIATEGNTPQPVDDYVAMLADAAAPVVASLNVSFTIQPGTGTGPWNTLGTIVETYIGQTLSLVNMDSRTHQMHTGGSPCPHGAAFASGATYKCIITKVYDSKVTPKGLYEHSVGPSANFYVVAYDGAALYNTNCMGCHGPLATSTKKGASVAMIQKGLATVPEMKNNAALAKLTQRQIEAISYNLGK
jgi:hypothetical protein